MGILEGERIIVSSITKINNALDVFEETINILEQAQATAEKEVLKIEEKQSTWLCYLTKVKGWIWKVTTVLDVLWSNKNSKLADKKLEIMDTADRANRVIEKIKTIIE